MTDRRGWVGRTRAERSYEVVTDVLFAEWQEAGLEVARID